MYRLQRDDGLLQVIAERNANSPYSCEGFFDSFCRFPR